MPKKKLTDSLQGKMPVLEGEKISAIFMNLLPLYSADIRKNNGVPFEKKRLEMNDQLMNWKFDQECQECIEGDDSGPLFITASGDVVRNLAYSRKDIQEEIRGYADYLLQQGEKMLKKAKAGSAAEITLRYYNQYLQAMKRGMRCDEISQYGFFGAYFVAFADITFRSPERAKEEKADPSNAGRVFLNTEEGKKLLDQNHFLFYQGAAAATDLFSLLLKEEKAPATRTPQQEGLAREEIQAKLEKLKEAVDSVMYYGTDPEYAEKIAPALQNTLDKFQKERGVFFRMKAEVDFRLDMLNNGWPVRDQNAVAQSYALLQRVLLTGADLTVEQRENIQYISERLRHNATVEKLTSDARREILEGLAEDLKEVRNYGREREVNKILEDVEEAFERELTPAEQAWMGRKLIKEFDRTKLSQDLESKLSDLLVSPEKAPEDMREFYEQVGTLQKDIAQLRSTRFQDEYDSKIANINQSFATISKKAQDLSTQEHAVPKPSGWASFWNMVSGGRLYPRVQEYRACENVKKISTLMSKVLSEQTNVKNKLTKDAAFRNKVRDTYGSEPLAKTPENAYKEQARRAGKEFRAIYGPKPNKRAYTPVVDTIRKIDEGTYYELPKKMREDQAVAIQLLSLMDETSANHYKTDGGADAIAIKRIIGKAHGMEDVINQRKNIYVKLGDGLNSSRANTKKVLKEYAKGNMEPLAKLITGNLDEVAKTFLISDEGITPKRYAIIKQMDNLRDLVSSSQGLRNELEKTNEGKAALQEMELIHTLAEITEKGVRAETVLQSGKIGKNNKEGLLADYLLFKNVNHEMISDLKKQTTEISNAVKEQTEKMSKEISENYDPKIKELKNAKDQKALNEMMAEKQKFLTETNTKIQNEQKERMSQRNVPAFVRALGVKDMITTLRKQYMEDPKFKDMVSEMQKDGTAKFMENKAAMNAFGNEMHKKTMEVLAGAGSKAQVQAEPQPQVQQVQPQVQKVQPQVQQGPTA